MRIRKMLREDYDRVIELWKRAELEHKPAGRDSRESIDRQIATHGDLMLVAEEGDEIIGAAIGSQDMRKGWVNRLAVVQGWRGRGVAKALLERIESRFDALGIKVLSVLIFEDNTESIGFFERAGYKEAHNVRYYSKRADPDA